MKNCVQFLILYDGTFSILLGNRINIFYSQRRISTRGTDKGVKEDFKLAMKRQVARSIEPLDNLIIKFLTSERDLLLQSLE
jgi:hypothetical protein